MTMCVSSASILFVLLALPVACSTGIKATPKTTGGTHGSTGVAGEGGGTGDGYAGEIAGASGGTGVSPLAGASGGTGTGGMIVDWLYDGGRPAGGAYGAGTYECWWQNSYGGPGGVASTGGMLGSPAEPDGWLASPARAAGPALSRTRVDAWTTMSNTGAPSGPRTGSSAVWTGQEMIVWGGYTDKPEATGGRYDPAGDKWLPVSTSVAPRPRQDHVAAWTGSEMIVWGGGDGTNNFTSGSRYDPASDKWNEMSSAGAPQLSYRPRAVWTGTEFLVWGTTLRTTLASTAAGGRYDPKTDTWKTISTTGAPVLQNGGSLVWTGKTAIVWGGYVDGTCDSAKGAIYDPATDTWLPTTTVGAPHPRSDHSAVWTGTQMIVWGGSNSSANAASYDPVADAWYALSENEAPSPRLAPALFFLPDDGTPGAGRMLVWGGGYSYNAATGALYDFVPDRWDVVAPFPSAPTTPNQDSTRTTVWTGTEMIAWDVGNGIGARYKP